MFFNVFHFSIFFIFFYIFLYSSIFFYIFIFVPISFFIFLFFLYFSVFFRILDILLYISVLSHVGNFLSNSLDKVIMTCNSWCNNCKLSPVIPRTKNQHYGGIEKCGPLTIIKLSSSSCWPINATLTSNIRTLLVLGQK